MKFLNSSKTALFLLAIGFMVVTSACKKDDNSPAAASAPACKPMSLFYGGMLTQYHYKTDGTMNAEVYNGGTADSLVFTYVNNMITQTTQLEHMSFPTSKDTNIVMTYMYDGSGRCTTVKAGSVYNDLWQAQITYSGGTNNVTRVELWKPTAMKNLTLIRVGYTDFAWKDGNVSMETDYVTAMPITHTTFPYTSDTLQTVTPYITQTRSMVYDKMRNWMQNFPSAYRMIHAFKLSSDDMLSTNGNNLLVMTMVKYTYDSKTGTSKPTSTGEGVNTYSYNDYGYPTEMFENGHTSTDATVVYDCR